MKNQKKFIALIIVTVLFLSSTGSVFADEVTGRQDYASEYTCCSRETFLKGIILSGLLEFKNEISLSAVNERTAKNLLCEVLEENKTVAKNISSYEIKEENGNTKIFLVYDYALSLCADAEVLAEKERILQTVKDGMSDMEKALVVHDYMTQNYEYDFTYSIYSAEGIFKNKTGVCQAYALAYQEIMKTLGIECKFVPSDAMNHAWNLVKIDGQWYHVDVTWDDPTPDLLGLTKHIFFLVSDDKLRSIEHYGWRTDENATSTKYDEYFWRDVSKPIIDNGGYWYFLDDAGHITKKNIETGVENVIYSITDKWKVWDMPGYAWNDRFSGIGIYGDRIYFNTPYEIKSVNFNGTGIRSECKPVTTAGDIYGFIITGGKIIYGLSTSPYNGIEFKSEHHIQYGVTFDEMDGNAESHFKTVIPGKLYGKLPKAIREGYNFLGWYTDKVGGTLVTEETVVTIAGDHTLYARWEKKPPEIEVTTGKKEGKNVVLINLKWVDSGCYIYVACFKEGKLERIERRVYAGEGEEFVVESGCDVKIMFWKNTAQMGFICEETDIDKNEFEK